MSDKPAYQFGESYEEKPQQDLKVNMEAYDPNDNDLPYMPTMPKGPAQPKPVQFVDLSNPANLTRQQAQEQGQPQVPNPVLEAEKLREPDFLNAEKKISQLDDLMGKMNNIVEEEPIGGGNNDKGYGVSTAIKSIESTIKVLQDVDYWIPEGKEAYAEKLKGIAKPMIKALEPYLQFVKQL